MTHRYVRTLGILTAVFIAMAYPWTTFALQYDPANNLYFMNIDDPENAADSDGIRFGGTLNKFLYYNKTLSTFIFTDNTLVQGNLEVTGSITGGGIPALVGETSLSSANAVITVTLTSVTEHLTCHLEVKGASASGIKFVRFNADTGAASYGWNSTGITGTATTDWQDASDSEIQLSGTVGGTNTFSTRMDITNFADTNKVVNFDSAGVEAVGTNSNRYSGVGGWYNTTDQITSVTFTLSTGTFNAGSHAWCLGKDVQ